ncbi:NlpC/P60 family protein [Bacteroidetes/Chlorobi group bacterium ChocPot_Mid]|jgi:cell wall-associated NlpC family hydrolase|nr:MAG: NlpC/P60 family protein [Bacteroidetes/Chlorobi group bacterium ChocPot_Mid]
MILHSNIIKKLAKILKQLSKIRNLSLLFVIISFIISSCTPQIRFATKNSNYTSNNNLSKTNTDRKINQGVTFTDNRIDFQALDKYPNLEFKRREVLTFAESYLGTPYCYGGIDKNCTDCSGFVKQIYEMAGINLPRTAALQYEYGKDISSDEPIPGDLVFFKNSRKISHVGIYVGNNQFIHASTNKGVVVQSLDDAFYKQNLAGFKKVLN